MRFVTIALGCFLLPGCAYYLTHRPPIMERKLGAPGNESIGALATAADYRMIYVKVKKEARICAEPPPDAAGQIASLVTASLKSSRKEVPVSAEMLNGFSMSMKQLFQRMQGVQIYRDGAFAYCNMYINEVIDESVYDKRMAELLDASAKLVSQELKDRQNYPDYDTTAPPDNHTMPEEAAESDATQATEKKEQQAKEEKETADEEKKGDEAEAQEADTSN